MGIEDEEKFPVLTDADGWQVLSQRLMREEEEELGSAWCDRAKAVQHMPAPACEKTEKVAPKRKPKKEEKDMKRL